MAQAADTTRFPHTHVVTAKTKFVGDVRHIGHIEIQGLVRGRVTAPSVSVKPGGVVDGVITTQRLRNEGTVTGSVRARHIELSRRSVIGGDVQFGSMGMEPGCTVRPDTSIMTLAPELIPDVSPDAVAREIDTVTPEAAPQRPRPTLLAVQPAAPIEVSPDLPGRRTASAPRPAAQPTAYDPESDYDRRPFLVLENDEPWDPRHDRVA